MCYEIMCILVGAKENRVGAHPLPMPPDSSCTQIGQHYQMLEKYGEVQMFR